MILAVMMIMAGGGQKLRGLSRSRPRCALADARGVEQEFCGSGLGSPFTQIAFSSSENVRGASHFRGKSQLRKIPDVKFNFGFFYILTLSSPPPSWRETVIFCGKCPTSHPGGGNPRLVSARGAGGWSGEKPKPSRCWQR